MRKQGSCAQYGMIALSPVAAGESVFEIPRSSLLTHETSCISDLIDRGNSVVSKTFLIAPSSLSAVVHNSHCYFVQIVN